ncbi:MAG: hypothetical protein ACSHXH_19385 [Marivita sp.]|uniref:hypothetical protein n=1 Tax=Marivita sp. TaxID=2003365 RepID=UPI003EF6A0A0
MTDTDAFALLPWTQRTTSESLPPARILTTPALITDAVTPLGGTTLLALLLTREERD